MSITPEQFNLLATKHDLKNYMTKDELNKKLDKILNIVDTIANNKEVLEAEKVVNIDAHDRFNDNFFKIKEHLNLESIEVVKPL